MTRAYRKRDEKMMVGQLGRRAAMDGSVLGVHISAWQPVNGEWIRVKSCT